MKPSMLCGKREYANHVSFVNSSHMDLVKYSSASKCPCSIISVVDEIILEMFPMNFKRKYYPHFLNVWQFQI